ncbi:hypothetical protein D3C81_2167880 [compost metagenome]
MIRASLLLVISSVGIDSLNGSPSGNTLGLERIMHERFLALPDRAYGDADDGGDGVLQTF